MEHITESEEMNRDTGPDKNSGMGADQAEEISGSPDIDNMESDFGDIDLSDLEFGNFGFADPKVTPETAGKDIEPKAAETPQDKEPEPEEEGKDKEPEPSEIPQDKKPKTAASGEDAEPGEPETAASGKAGKPKETDSGSDHAAPDHADSDVKIRVSRKKKRASSGNGEKPAAPEREGAGKGPGNKKKKKKRKPEPVPDPDDFDDYDDYDEEDEEELEEERKSNRRWLVFLLVSTLAAAAVLGIYYGCTVRSVTVKGNKLYTSEQIAEYVISDDTQLRHNTAFLTVLYHTPFAPKIPFVEKVSVMPTSYDAIEITVKDKELAAYIPYGGRNLYFNADGIVMENSPLTVRGVTYVTGITLNSAEIGMPLSSENSAGLFLVLDALQILRKYEIKAESIVLTQKGSVTMFIDDIRVILGRSDFELKIAKIAQLKPYLEGRKGTIDLTNYSSSDQNIILK